MATEQSQISARPEIAGEPRVHHRIDDFDLPEFVAEARRFPINRYGYVVTPNADHFIRLHEDAQFRAHYDSATYVLLDSRFVALILKQLKRLSLRVCTGADLTEALLRDVVAPTDRVVLIGCSDDQAQALRDLYGLKDLVHHNPPMGFIRDPHAVEECLAFVESHSPFRFCFLAVGSPQQEHLAATLAKRARARGLALCIGASINFLTQAERRAPRWIQNLTLEWLFRLLQNPRRLFHRYAIRGPRVFRYLIGAEVTLRAAHERAAEAPRWFDVTGTSAALRIARAASRGVNGT